MGKQYFVFTNPMDVDVYDFLKAEFEREVDQIALNASARLVGAGEDTFDNSSLADEMANDLHNLFSDNSPLDVELTVYGDLLTNAIDEIDFKRIALAFLEDVETYSESCRRMK